MSKKEALTADPLAEYPYAVPTPRGVSYCRTPEAADALMAFYANGKAPAVPRTSSPAPRATAKATLPEKLNRNYLIIGLHMLRVLRERERMSSSEVTGELGISKPKALALVTGAIGKALTPHGLTVRDACRKLRTSDGSRVWRPGDKVARAIEIIEEINRAA
jgi:hypothetical protein